MDEAEREAALREVRELDEFQSSERRRRETGAEKVFRAYDATAAAERGDPKPDNVVPLRGSDDSDQKPNGKLVLRRARLPPAEQIYPRQWLYGTQLIRGAVSILVAPGGTGKSAYALAVAMCLTSGRAFLGDHIFVRVNVAVINLDDPMDELERRVAAIQKAHGISNEQLEGLFLEDCDGHRLTLAKVERTVDGFEIVYPDETDLIRLIKENNIGLLVCDPYSESHTLEENSNPQMIQAMAVWRRIARATNCAVLLVHHVRKGDAAGHIDAARGAKATTDSGRIGLLMTTMSAEEADRFHVPEDERLSYIRLDDAKRNLAAAAKAKWFRLKPVRLGNTAMDPLYPNGDTVAAIAPWQAPQDELATAPNQDLNAALDAIAAGPGDGLRYTATKQGGKGSRWCGNVLCDMFHATEKEAGKMLRQWLQSGLLYEDEYRHPTWRRMVPCVQVNDTLRPS